MHRAAAAVTEAQETKARGGRRGLGALRRSDLPLRPSPMNAGSSSKEKTQGSEDVQPPESGKQLCLFVALRRAALGWKHREVRCLGSS